MLASAIVMAIPFPMCCETRVPRSGRWYQGMGGLVKRMESRKKIKNQNAEGKMTLENAKIGQGRGDGYFALLGLGLIRVVDSSVTALGLQSE